MPLSSNSKTLWQIRSALYAASFYAGQSRDKKTRKVKNREIRTHVHYIYQMRVSHHHSNGKSNLPPFFFQFRRDLVKMSII
jgi:hypothetical protein